MLQRVPPQRMMAMYLTKSLIHVDLHRIPIVKVHLLASMEVAGCASVSKGLNDMSCTSSCWYVMMTISGQAVELHTVFERYCRNSWSGKVQILKYWLVTFRIAMAASTWMIYLVSFTYGIFSPTLIKFVWVNILTCTHVHPSKWIYIWSHRLWPQWRCVCVCLGDFSPSTELVLILSSSNFGSNVL